MHLVLQVQVAVGGGGLFASGSTHGDAGGLWTVSRKATLASAMVALLQHAAAAFHAAKATEAAKVYSLYCIDLLYAPATLYI